MPDSHSSHDEPEPKTKTGLLANEFVRILLVAGCLAVILCLLGFFFHGKTGAEKTITRLVMPFGLFWLLLSAWTVHSLFSGPRSKFLCAAAIWTVLTACSCGPIAGKATAYLEAKYSPPELTKTDPLDVVVVLGGGARESMFRAQAGEAGDRILYGAQLYLSGFTRKLVTTGDAIESIQGKARKSPKELTIELWKGLGIPEEDILTLNGINTYEEIKSLTVALDSELKDARVGLLTSALHLPRAMRLAKARGIEDQVTPIPADYRANNLPKTYMDYLPSSANLKQLAAAQHEFMAKLVNR